MMPVALEREHRNAKSSLNGHDNPVSHKDGKPLTQNDRQASDHLRHRSTTSEHIDK
jgi:hypothetical protein